MASGLLAGFTVNFPEETATARKDMREIGPAILMSPPRIWENMVSDVQVMAEDTTRLKRWAYRWAMKQGAAAAEARFRGRTTRPSPAPAPPPGRLDGLPSHPRPAGAQPGKARVHGRRGAGPRRLSLLPCHRRQPEAALRADRGLGDFGGAPGTATSASRRWASRCRARRSGFQDDGEILCRSPAVFQGYFRNPEATAETLEDGWLHSGDAGYFDDSGHLVVIDRLADVMKLADGSSFSPQFVENKLKFSPYIREAVVFGGGDADFVTAMIAIDMENAGQWAERRRIPYTTFTDLARRPEVYALVRDHMAEVNRELPAAARIRRFLLLHKELHADDAELTRTRKVRRRHIGDRFADIIHALQGDADSVTVATEITYQDGRTAAVEHELRIETMGR